MQYSRRYTFWDKKDSRATPREETRNMLISDELTAEAADAMAIDRAKEYAGEYNRTHMDESCALETIYCIEEGKPPRQVYPKP